MSEEPRASRDDLTAALDARRELGPDHERELVESFLDRVERDLERRVADRAPARRDYGSHEQRRFILAMVSVAAGVPLTAIALGAGGLAALIVVWAGIVLVNLAFARRPL